jgi:hypothetical protein
MSMHQFDTDVAKEFGIEESIILQNMLFWIEKNIANQRHFYEGRYWTYNSVRAFSELFPYMTDAKIRRSLKRLEEAGMIITGRFNKVNYDRTLWYSLTEKAFVKMNSSICQNEQMDLSKTVNGFVQNDKPIPDINPDAKPDTKTHIPTPAEKREDERFLIFYQNYPRKVGKKKARTAFNKVMKEGETLDSILSKLKTYEKQIARDKTEEKYIKHPASFLNCLEDFEEEEPQEKKEAPKCPKCGKKLSALFCDNCMIQFNSQLEEL